MWMSIVRPSLAMVHATFVNRSVAEVSLYGFKLRTRLSASAL
jgi:hypothetical protein